MAKRRVLLALAIVFAVGIVGAVVAVTRSNSLAKHGLTSTLKKLHLATQSMALDNETTGASPIRWTCSGTTPLTVAQWTNALVQGGYLSEGDLRELLAARDEQSITNVLTVFAVTESDPGNTVLLATKPGKQASADNRRSANEITVFYKGGDVAVVQPNNISATNLVGSGGMHNFLRLR